MLKDLDKEMRAAVREASAEAVDAEIDTLNEGVKRWDNKIVFRRQERIVGLLSSEVLQSTWAEGDPKALEIFGYVDLGTEPHLIFPKKAGGMLAFNTPYSAMTAPIANFNAGTGKSGSNRVYSKGVLHPGTEARDFIAFAMLSADESFQTILQEKIDRLNKQ